MNRVKSHPARKYSNNLGRVVSYAKTVTNSRWLDAKRYGRRNLPDPELVLAGIDIIARQVDTYFLHSRTNTSIVVS
jgi:hypothetical protein